MSSPRLFLDTTIAMCSGVCCPKRNECYHYALNHFYDVIARQPHPNPEFLEPSTKCNHFTPIRYIE